MEHSIPFLMPPGIVNNFKVIIYIHHDERQMILISLSNSKGMISMLHPHTAVINIGEIKDMNMISFLRIIKLISEEIFIVHYSKKWRK